ncbi:AAWKG family protein [Streptomyces griseoaurantiacus]|uniref:AAWKG family protein n=1 Tax=Streptomyces griseoaurantiacus TaxID=68213 RepID=UPI00345F711C
MADSTSGVPTYDEGDYFAQAVISLTGYPVPSRSSLFNSLSSSSSDDFSDLKLFRMEISGEGMRSVTEADYSALYQQRHTGGDDYVLAFYDAGGDGAHSSVSFKKARIIMIGVGVDENGRATLWGDKQISGGGKFEGSYSHTQWDSGPMAQYISGSKLALDRMIDSLTTEDFEYAGASVSDANAVDLNSFITVGQSFDRVMNFFTAHADTIDSWMKSLGEDQAAWKGKAASLFWHLLKELKTNYDGYVTQLGGRNFSPNFGFNDYHPKTNVSNALLGAMIAARQAVLDVQKGWESWAKDGKHDPHYHLVKKLDEVSKFVIQNNINHVKSHTTTYGTYGGGTSTSTSYSTEDGFKQVSAYGDLTQKTTWQKIADAAVSDWEKHADATVVAASMTALSRMKNAWAEALDVVKKEIKNKNTETLQEVYTKQENQIAKDEAKDNNDKLNKYLDDLGDNVNDLGDNFNKLGDNFNDLNDDLNDNLNNIGDNFKDLNDGLNDSFDNLGDNFNSFGDSFNDLNKGLNDNLKGLNDGIGDNFKTFSDDLNDAFSSGNDNLNEALGGNSDLNKLLNDDPNNPLNPAMLLNRSLFDGGDGTDDKTKLKSVNGATTQLNDDGTLGTDFPDGSHTTFDPDTGDLTTIDADGNKTTTHLNPGDTFTNPDGSTTKLNDDGTLTTTFPDGSKQTLDPATGQVTTLNPDGSLADSGILDPTDGAFTTPGGGTSQLNADGSLSSDFPDGSHSTFNPDTGDLTLTDSDGNTTTTHLNPGDTFTNPDGSTTKLNDDGTLTTTFPDGSKQTLNPDTGELTTTDPQGHTTTTDLVPNAGSFTTPDGGTAHLSADGSLNTDFPDGSHSKFDPDTGDLTLTDSDGNTTTTHLNPGDTFTNPDGSTVKLNDDGTLTTTFPDGSKQTLNPDTGELTTTDPQGHTTTTDLNGPGLPNSSLNTDGLNLDGLTSHSTPDFSNLNGNPDSFSFSGGPNSLNGGGLGGDSLTSNGLDSDLDGEYDDYDSTPYGGGSLRSGGANQGVSLNAGFGTDAQDAQTAPGGTPMNPMAMGGAGGAPMGGGMPMGGMGGGGGGQGGNSERTRAVLTDPTGGRRGRMAGRAAGVDEDEDIVYTRPTTSSSPYPVGGPGAAGQNGRSTESGDRAREAWLAEDEDVWGTDEGGAPAVLGR